MPTYSLYNSNTADWQPWQIAWDDQSLVLNDSAGRPVLACSTARAAMQLEQTQLLQHHRVSLLTDAGELLFDSNEAAAIDLIRMAAPLMEQSLRLRRRWRWRWPHHLARRFIIGVTFILFCYLAFLGCVHSTGWRQITFGVEGGIGAFILFRIFKRLGREINEYNRDRRQARRLTRLLRQSFL